jgi:hypothetical protein
MASAINLNYNHKAIASVVNYDCKCDATIWSVNLTSTFTIVNVFIIQATADSFCRQGLFKKLFTAV